MKDKRSCVQFLQRLFLYSFEELEALQVLPLLFPLQIIECLYGLTDEPAKDTSKGNLRPPNGSSITIFIPPFVQEDSLIVGSGLD